MPCCECFFNFIRKRHFFNVPVIDSSKFPIKEHKKSFVTFRDSICFAECERHKINLSAVSQGFMDIIFYNVFNVYAMQCCVRCSIF